MRYLLLMLCFMIVGCDSSEQPTPDPDPVEEEPPVERVMLIPLEVGNQWVYESDFSGATDTVRVTDVLQVGGLTLFHTQSPSYVGEAEEPYYIDHDLWGYSDEGLVLIDTLYDTADRWMYFYPDVLINRGDRFYDQDGITNGRRECTTEFRPDDGSISIEGVAYEAYVYRHHCTQRSTGEDLGPMDVFFVPRLGIVRRAEWRGSYWTRLNITESSVGDLPFDPEDAP